MPLLKAYERKPISAEGRYVYVRACSAPVTIRFFPSGVTATLGFGEQYDVGRNDPSNRFTRLEVYNTTGVDNNVDIEAGEDAFVAAAAGIGSSVNIASTSIALPVYLQMPADINSMPPVNFAANQSVNVGNFPASFQVSNFPAFPSSFEVSNWPAVQTVQQKDPVINGLADISFDVANKTIAAKAGRKGLILQAPETNQGDIVVQGFLRVAPGAIVPFPASNQISLAGTVGDALYVGEEM
ncbi:hypothetical protein ACQEXU_13205 [Vibrio sp. TRT 21S02]|uniref:hypothetical protein n=1 Tax=Vibrio sp. TRT 21S02 TaxID=3418507 RepID=UPI003CF267CA